MLRPISNASAPTAAYRPIPILDEVLRAAPEIHPTLAKCLLDNLGIGDRIVRRGEHIQDLARSEADHVLMMLRNSTHVRGCRLPPKLLEKECLGEKIVRPLLPGLGSESLVMGQWFDASALRAGGHAALHDVAAEPECQPSCFL